MDFLKIINLYTFHAWMNSSQTIVFPFFLYFLLFPFYISFFKSESLKETNWICAIY